MNHYFGRTLPMETPMENWDFRYAFEFWDQSSGAINENAIRLGKLGGAERVAACSQIRDAMQKHTQALSDSQLLKMAVSLVDDLYKYVNDAVYLDPALFEYLDAFGRTFTKSVRERGHVIHYVVDNQFSGVDFLMQGPFDIFPRVFNAAGFLYVCPQQFGLQLMQHDGVAASEYAQTIDRYIIEARVLADRLVNESHAEGHHYVFLDADYAEGSLDTALRGNGAPGVLSIFRNDAPIPDSTVSVGFPERKFGS